MATKHIHHFKEVTIYGQCLDCDKNIVLHVDKTQVEQVMDQSGLPRPIPIDTPASQM